MNININDKENTQSVLVIIMFHWCDKFEESLSKHYPNLYIKIKYKLQSNGYNETLMAYILVGDEDQIDSLCRKNVINVNTNHVLTRKIE